MQPTIIDDVGPRGRDYMRPDSQNATWCISVRALIPLKDVDCYWTKYAFLVAEKDGRNNRPAWALRLRSIPTRFKAQNPSAQWFIS